MKKIYLLSDLKPVPDFLKKKFASLCAQNQEDLLDNSKNICKMELCIPD